ncbi:hypothetical protein [Streptomyces sp. CBMA156]|uniref:hypothetical protein n=1 Tax=Streptomyces sp. CBMA156 TaxID=1930280 RepID=UPI001661DE51|nr:hypothetical protein [Streptomyces sp. CBMA156]MBD0674548.1 hypothetical protein [Streptomyces sp. CBMA156]
MRARIATTLTVLTALTLTVPALAASPALAAPAPALTAQAPAPSWTADLTAPAGFVGMSPTRVLDTRTANTPYHNGFTPLGPREYYQAVVSEVPHEATAVVVNVTATNPTAEGYLSVRGESTLQDGTPDTSSLNFTPGRTVSNLVTVALDQDGVRHTVKIFNSAGTTDVILDVVGYYVPGAADKFTPLRPKRIADSRTDGTGRLGSSAARSIQVARPGLDDADARAVVLDVTATEGTENSFLTVYPTGTTRPAEGSDVTVPVRRGVTNRVVVPVGTDGKVDIYNHVGSVTVIVDIVGYYSPSGTGLFQALRTPVRLNDTRTTGHKMTGPTDMGLGIEVDPKGVGAELNITTTNADSAGHLTVFPGTANGGVPGTSTLDYVPGLTVAGSATTGLDHDSTAFSMDNSGGAVDVITDLTGYFTTG